MRLSPEGFVEIQSSVEMGVVGCGLGALLLEIEALSLGFPEASETLIEFRREVDETIGDWPEDDPEFGLSFHTNTLDGLVRMAVATVAEAPEDSETIDPVSRMVARTMVEEYERAYGPLLTPLLPESLLD